MPVMKCPECLAKHIKSPYDDLQLIFCYHRFQEIRQQHVQMMEKMNEDMKVGKPVYKKSKIKKNED
jgi:hypothetical protein